MYTIQDLCAHVTELEKEPPEVRQASDRLHDLLEQELGAESNAIRHAEELSADCMYENHINGFRLGFRTALELLYQNH